MLLMGPSRLHLLEQPSVTAYMLKVFCWHASSSASGLSVRAVGLEVTRALFSIHGRPGMIASILCVFAWHGILLIIYMQCLSAMGLLSLQDLGQGIP